VRGIALVIDAVNIILRHLGEMPDGPAVRELRVRAVAYKEGGGNVEDGHERRIYEEDS